MTNQTAGEPLALSLRSGEKVLWTGRPSTERLRNPHVDEVSVLGQPVRVGARLGALTDIGVVLVAIFALLWTSFVLRSLVGTGAHPAAYLFPAFGIAMVAACWYISLGRHVHNRRRRRDTRYVLTNQRAVVVLPHRPQREWVFRPGVRPVSTWSRPDGRGTIVFVEEAPYGTPFMRVPASAKGDASAGLHGVQFFLIERVRDVEKLLHQQLNALTDDGSHSPGKTP